MAKSRVLILIPARYASSRFPGKPLAMIDGKSMIQRVFENCTSMGTSPSFDTQVYIVTDDDKIEAHVKSFKGNVVRVNEDVVSGTERIHLAFQKSVDKDFDLIVNVQGDEPLLPGFEVERLCQFHLDNKSFDITTFIKMNSSKEDFKNPDIVKAVVTPSGKCLYFSRSGIPFDRDGKALEKWWQHIGVYSFRPTALQKFCETSIGNYEDIEKLEQLRALEQDMTIGALVTEIKLIGVDRPEDLKKLEGVFNE